MPELSPPGATTWPDLAPTATSSRTKTTPTGTAPTRTTPTGTAPTGTVTGAPATAEVTETGLPAVAVPRAETAQQPRADTKQSARDVADNSQPGVGAIHEGSNGVADQATNARVVPAVPAVARVIPARAAVPAVARVIPAVARIAVAAVTGRVAVLVGQDLLQAANRIATEISARQCIGRGQRELVWCHIDQAGVIHGLLGATHEGRGRRGITEQVQDVLDQRVHDRFPLSS
jgi:hypothetical protein